MRRGGDATAARSDPEIYNPGRAPFFRGEQAQRGGSSGVGLGLALAHRIAATFRGTIEARSEPGAGSLFILRLPEAARAIDPDLHSTKDGPVELDL